MIRISHASKRYSGGLVLALDRVDLQVAKGEFLALLGPSGCGKSTLLHAIAGLVPVNGTIAVSGARVEGPGLERAIVFQDYALFPWRTVLDNVAFGLEVRGVPARDRAQRAREHLALVGLEEFAERYPAQLSGGMKQRVAIARALACDPDVLLLDEPFAALDAQTRETLQAELLGIWERTGKTIVFVTHAIEEAVFLAQRVAVFTARPGRIKEIVPVDLPPDRAGRDVRGTPEFAAIRHRLWVSLSDEVRRASQEQRAHPGAPAPGDVRPGILGALHRVLRRGLA
ncbi:ABC transporter ATP-binding protein [Anaeromyxobacter paludicola]|uniref:ABC transporter ATP-binding protein n=1 Tax=Anaeromyxobacter paludicola TaxID=2918171 RepID=A0ABM7XFU9_9BACT|nr:ABC transporter ATP-binding protein [Anaeromyxobacter paludicola]BDG10774.1 ABC transporter ATP-binding protein [Anaeromyxobacter paludicola]